MTIVLVALLAAAVLLVLVAVVGRRRARAREARRVEALAQLAERLEASLEDLRPPTFQPVEPAAPPRGGTAPLVAERRPDAGVPDEEA
jgi:type II secretory pathway pseudopilin PulG